MVVFHVHLFVLFANQMDFLINSLKLLHLYNTFVFPSLSVTSADIDNNHNTDTSMNKNKTARWKIKFLMFCQLGLEFFLILEYVTVWRTKVTP